MPTKTPPISFLLDMVAQDKDALERNLNDIQYLRDQASRLCDEKLALEAEISRKKTEARQKPRRFRNPEIAHILARINSARESFWRAPNDSQEKHNLWEKIGELHKELKIQLLKEPLH